MSTCFFAFLIAILMQAKIGYQPNELPCALACAIDTINTTGAGETMMPGWLPDLPVVKQTKSDTLPGIIHKQTKTVATLCSVPKITAVVADTTGAAGFGAMIMTTNARDFIGGRKSADSVPSSIQIIDPVTPWPPIWFALTSSGFYQNAQMEPNGDIAFYEYQYDYNNGKGLTNRFAGKYRMLRGFKSIDSIVSHTVSFDPHDFSINAANERLMLTYFDTTLNISSITKNIKDTTVRTSVGVIEIWDSTGNCIFKWNPLYKLKIDERFPGYLRFGQLSFTPDEFDWNHANSVNWSEDGNILYSFRNIGVGKINRLTGEIIWKLGGLDAGIKLNDAETYYGQHNFSQITSGPYKNMYSVFSDGNQYTPAQGYVYAVDEATKSAKAVHHLLVDSFDYALAAGNYTWVNKTQLLCYGVLFSFSRDTALSLTFARLANTENVELAHYHMPTGNYVYKIQAMALVKSWKKHLPKRPRIRAEGGTLTADRENNGEISWYEISRGNCTYVGDGLILKPAENGVFVVIEKLAFGYTTSEPFSYTK